MFITKDQAVTFTYTLKSSSGDLIDSSDGKDPLAYLHGHGNLIPGLEKELEGKKVGDAISVVVPAAEGYGLSRDDLVTTVSRAELAGISDLEVGLQLQAESSDGEVRVVTIRSIEEDTVTLDGNHPLAGQDLHFDVSIVAIRAASQEELTHGHVHGPGGHHH